VRDIILLPEYHHVRLPSEAYVMKVTSWVEKVQSTKITVRYEDMVERKFAGD